MRASRALLLLALVPLFGLAGCLEDGMEPGVHSSSVSCSNGDCVVCADDECAECEDSECEECRDGDCAAFARAREEAAIAGPLADEDIQETHPLTTGLPETTWSFDVARGATGHVRFTVSDVATGKTSVGASACIEYEVDGPGAHSTGSQGSNCSGGNLNLVVSGSTNGSPWTVLEWDPLPLTGHYEFTVSAPPQGNELVVDIVVDNP
jgi:hypothetical protein